MELWFEVHYTYRTISVDGNTIQTLAILELQTGELSCDINYVIIISVKFVYYLNGFNIAILITLDDILT